HGRLPSASVGAVGARIGDGGRLQPRARTSRHRRDRLRAGGRPGRPAGLAGAGRGPRGARLVSLCVLAGAKTLTLAITAFTLSWTPSVEKSRWEEHWRVTPAGLEVVEAKVKGSGAGMDPAPDSVFRDGWYVYEPHLAPQKALHLAASGATVSGW